jgi:hypothetical protein
MERLMQLEITGKEKDLLTKILKAYHSTLRGEIYKTEDFRVKSELKNEESMIQGLQEKLQAIK